MIYFETTLFYIDQAAYQSFDMLKNMGDYKTSSTKVFCIRNDDKETASKYNGNNTAINKNTIEASCWLVFYKRQIENEMQNVNVNAKPKNI